MPATAQTLKLAYTVKEVADSPDFPIGKTALYALISSGQLRTVKVGGKRLIPGSALLDLIEGGHA